MAEEAFALSPIAARPNVPGEADYDAIREAFMETARGRWFLTEYAKRNRTADTSLVLDAVTRLEANLAAQKQAPALSLVAALGAIRSAVRHAKATAIEAMPRVDSDETLTGARNGARIIREIAWTLRECGADTRICDLLDTQVKAIETGQQALNGNGREDVLGSYDLLMQRIEQMVDGIETPAPQAAAEPAPVAATRPAEPAAEIREASVTPLFKSQASEALAETVAALRPEPTVAAAEPAMAETIAAEPVAAESLVAESIVAQAAVSETAATETIAEAAAPIAEASAELAATMAEASAAMATDDTAHAPDAIAEAEAEHDLAVLDMVAAEMGALDMSEPELAEADVVQAELAVTEVLVADVPAPELVAPEFSAPESMRTDAIAVPVARPEPVSADLMTLAQIAEVALAPEPPQPTPAPQASPEPASLGAALIANGVIANPNAPASDPLAPIRKMTQAEKIAFFS
jgi:hypothetical protein